MHAAIHQVVHQSFFVWVWQPSVGCTHLQRAEVPQAKQLLSTREGFKTHQEGKVKKIISQYFTFVHVCMDRSQTGSPLSKA
jgi:hypothetical protein